MWNIQKVYFEQVFFFHCVQKAFQAYTFILPEPLTENNILKDRNNSSSNETLNTKDNSLFPQNLLFDCNMTKVYLGFSTIRGDRGV